MKINKNSWHYKLNDYFGSSYNMPKTLCSYFWSTVFKVAVVLFIVLLVGTSAWLVGVPLLTLILAKIGITLGAISSNIAGTIFGVSLFASSIGVIVGIIIGTVALENKYEERKYDKAWERKRLGIPDKEPNFIIAFLKAKKQKYCPMIEYVQSNEKAKSE